MEQSEHDMCMDCEYPAEAYEACGEDADEDTVVAYLVERHCIDCPRLPF